jgi:agmatine deiminase
MTNDWRMPAEWEPHERTWMALPTPNETFGEEGSLTLSKAREAWSHVAQTIARFEPVTLITGTNQEETARALVGPNVQIVVRPLDDAWMRDIGPTFTLRDGELGAIDWVFNGWGAQPWATWDNDALIASDIGTQSGASLQHSKLTNEGGGFHVDGAGTVLLTDTVQLDPQRNPGWTRDEVEYEIHARLGTSHAIWLPRGLTRDYDEFGTRGHVDIVATFVRPGVVAVHHQLDPVHPDYNVTRELLEILRASTDATGRELEVIEVPAPRVTMVENAWTDYSYINHYVGNGFVIVGTFDDPSDEEALELLARLYPDRHIEPVDGREIFAHGGGVHCITQQEPRIPATS